MNEMNEDEIATKPTKKHERDLRRPLPFLCVHYSSACSLKGARRGAESSTVTCKRRRKRGISVRSSSWRYRPVLGEEDCLPRAADLGKGIALGACSKGNRKRSAQPSTASRVGHDLADSPLLQPESAVVEAEQTSFASSSGDNELRVGHERLKSDLDVDVVGVRARTLLRAVETLSGELGEGAVLGLDDDEA